MKKKFNSIYIGLILGIVAPLLVLVGFYLYNHDRFSLGEMINFLVAQEVFTKVLSLCVIPNLLLFFIFIWSNKLFSARGVLVSTFIYAFVILLLKFIL